MVGKDSGGLNSEVMLLGVAGGLINARQILAATTETAREVVREVAASGVSERQIAQLTGLSRDTVRRWLGK